MELTKTDIKRHACRSLGEALFLERRCRRLNLSRLSKKSLVPIVDIDNIETGRSSDIGKILRLLFYYQKKVEIKLID